MSERDGYEHGVPCFASGVFPDPEAAVRFYTELFSSAGHAVEARRRSITASIAQWSHVRHSPPGSRQSQRPVPEHATVSRPAEQRPGSGRWSRPQSEQRGGDGTGRSLLTSKGSRAIPTGTKRGASTGATLGA
jgi:hypothetical protein